MAHTGFIWTAFSLLSLVELTYGLPRDLSTNSLEITLDLSNGNDINLNGIKSHCSQGNDTFKCCLGVEAKLNVTTCISLQYLSEEFGFELNVTLNDLMIYNEKISARNPPPVCFGVPYLEKIANVCFTLYNLGVTDKTLDGCAEIVGNVEVIKVFDIKLGCFHLPLFLKKNDRRLYYIKY